MGNLFVKLSEAIAFAMQDLIDGRVAPEKIHIYREGRDYIVAGPTRLICGESWTPRRRILRLRDPNSKFKWLA